VHRHQCLVTKDGEVRFELTLRDSKSLVLPLHHSPMLIAVLDIFQMLRLLCFLLSLLDFMNKLLGVVLFLTSLNTSALPGSQMTRDHRIHLNEHEERNRLCEVDTNWKCSDEPQHCGPPIDPSELHWVYDPIWEFHHLLLLARPYPDASVVDGNSHRRYHT
jgi:hypothetical protein